MKRTSVESGDGRPIIAKQLYVNLDQTFTLSSAQNATIYEALLRSFELRGDQVGVDPLALRLEVDPVFHEELGSAGTRGVPVDEHSFVRIPPHPVSQHFVV